MVPLRVGSGMVCELVLGWLLCEAGVPLLQGSNGDDGATLSPTLREWREALEAFICLRIWCILPCWFERESITIGTSMFPPGS